MVVYNKPEYIRSDELRIRYEHVCVQFLLECDFPIGLPWEKRKETSKENLSTSFPYNFEADASEL